MTQENDFKGALKDLNKAMTHWMNPGKRIDLIHRNWKEIETALRIADRLQSGEVSESMKMIGTKSQEFIPGCGPNIGPSQYEKTFKAMIKQMIDEVCRDTR